MIMHVNDVLNLIVTPALKYLGTPGDARALVLGTGLLESNFEAIKQVNGPALGPWQIEPVTAASLWKDTLPGLPDYQRRLKNSLGLVDDTIDALTYNWRYNAMLCRLIYFRSPLPLPRADNPEELTWFYKKVYNTEKGKAKIDKAEEAFKISVKLCS